MFAAVSMAILAVLPLSLAADDSPPSPPVLKAVGKPFVLPVKMPPSEPNGAYTEVPAWVATDESGPRYFLPTGFTYVAKPKPGKSILTDADAFGDTPAILASQEDTRASGYADPSRLNPNLVWRRNYYGIYSAHLLEPGLDGKRGYLAILHGENKNEAFPDKNRYYDNTVLPSRSYKIPDEYSGWFDGSYRDYWPAYFAFVSAAWSPADENDGCNFDAHDLGPIVWPSAGYVTANGGKAGNGLRAPSSIIEGGYIYVYYLDGCSTEVEGRESGIKVSRAPISNDGMPGPFMNYYNGSFSEPSLPAGFTKDNARAFLSSCGGKSSKVHPDLGWNTNRFSVAKLEGTDCFISVEERFQNQDGSMVFLDYLRLSKDLVHWSEAAALPGTESRNGTGFDNPVLANEDFTSNTLVSPKAFYAIGSGWVDAKMKAIKVCLDMEKQAKDS